MSARTLIELVARDATEELTRGNCLVLAPHPDDDILGCGGTIALKARAGAVVAVVFLTDGGRGLPVRADTGVIREGEAVEAAGILGLPPDRLIFLRYPDGELGDCTERAVTDVGRLVADFEVRDLFVPYRKEFHADHTAAWRIGRACLPPGGRIFEYPVWYGPWIWPRLGWRARAASALHLAAAARAVKVRVTGVLDLKRRAMSAHRTQGAAFGSSGVWGETFLAGFLGDYELFFTGP